MRWFKFIIILFIFMWLNAANVINALNPLNFFFENAINIRPDFLLILLIFFAVNAEPSDAILASFLIGFSADLCSSAMAMGPYTIVYTLFGFMLSQTRKVVIMKETYHQAISIFILGLITSIFAQILVFIKIKELSGNIWLVIPSTALFSAIIGPFIWYFLSRLLGWFGLGKRKYSRVSSR